MQLWDCAPCSRLPPGVQSSLLPDLISLETVSKAIFCTPASTSLMRSTMSSKFCLTARSCRGTRAVQLPGVVQQLLKLGMQAGLAYEQHEH